MSILAELPSCVCIFGCNLAWILVSQPFLRRLGCILVRIQDLGMATIVVNGGRRSSSTLY